MLGNRVYFISIIIAFSLFSTQVFAQLGPEDCGPNQIFKNNQCLDIDTLQVVVAWDKPTYKICDTGVVTIQAQEENTDPNLIQIFFAQVTSDSDPVGVEILMIEIGNDSGIFVGELQLCGDLNVSVGDKVYVTHGNVGDAADIVSSNTQSVDIQAQSVLIGDSFAIQVFFFDASGNFAEHVNYDIIATQKGKTVLSDIGVHDHDGQSQHYPFLENYNDLIEVKVTFNGFGIDKPFTGPIGHVETFLFDPPTPETEPEPEPIPPPGSNTIIIPTGASDPNAPYFWQNKKDGSTTGNITILRGETITWTNADTAFHTITSGSPSNGPDGKFDSAMFAPGESFSYKFSQEGIFPYFCMLHPWKVGTVIVEVESTFSVIQNVGDDAGDGSTTFDVEYEFNRVIADATVDEKQKSITFTLVGKPQNNDNTLTLYLSKDLISNPNVVWADGKSVTDFEVISEGGINVVTIPVTETTEQVTILGAILGGSVVTQPESEPTPEPVEEPEPTPKPKPIPEPTPAPTPAPTPTQNDDLSEIIEENKKLREELERQGEQIDELSQEVDWLKQIIQSIQGFFRSIFG